MKTYNFGDALSWIMDNEKPARLTINNVTRTYYKSVDNKIICIPNNKIDSAYLMKDFKLDAILSNDWELLD